MVGDREKTIAAGCSGYIEKPIDPGTFVDQISPFLLKKVVKKGENQCPGA
jgi:AmiR/NasT family two-component response regulator